MPGTHMAKRSIPRGAPRDEGVPGPRKPISPRRASRLAHGVSALLRSAYGSPDHNNKQDPLDELVFIVLSQMTTHHSYGRVYQRLKEVYPLWDDVLAVELEELQLVIEDAGLSR